MNELSVPRDDEGLWRHRNVVAIFPTYAAIIRLVMARTIETNDAWAVARRYLGFSRWPASPILTTTGRPPWSVDHVEPFRRPALIHHASRPSLGRS